jgi:16S rRNA (uracil1498-N3)-methyltransferase
MSPLRAWIDPAQARTATTGSRLRLSGEESAHLVRSLRARRGDALVLLDGEGHLLEGKLESADGDGSIVEVTRTRTVERVRPSITVAQGMPKGGTMDDLVRGVCEAGASEVVPLETARCEVKLDADRARTRTMRWQQQAVEACKQSGHPWLAHIGPPMRFDAWLATLPPCAPGELRLTGSLEFDAQPVGELDFASATKVLWLIGPEGDLTVAEYLAARAAGFRPVVLGPTVLRAENAALACVVITQALAHRR